MLRRRIVIIAAAGLAVGTALACGGGQVEGPEMAPATPPDPTPTEAAQTPVDGDCADDCLLLLRFEHRDLAKNVYCDTCGGEGCSGWPPDEFACEEVDRLRNCMYARLGYTFDKAEEWRDVFDKEPWYTPRDDFEWSDVSELQRRNADWLKTKRKRRDCTR